MPKVNVVFDELQLSGEDAETFLQGQTTADVRFSEGDVRLTAFCTAKGKVLSSGFCWRKGQSFHLLLLPGEGEFLQAQLNRYRLRAKVEFSVSVRQGQGVIDPAQQHTFRHTDNFIALLPGLGIALQESAMDCITETSL
jgi:folate-binding Fe-S cluster repair protein YgfZ